MPKKTLKIVKDSDNDALVQIKRNQPTLFDTLTSYAESAPATSQTHGTSDSGRRNRIESRHATVWSIPDSVRAQLPEWPSICSLVRIERGTDLFDPALRDLTHREETAWYLCTRPMTAEHANAAVRGHWAIENSLHYVRDVVFLEDASRIRKHPGIFARLRSWSLNLIRLKGFRHIHAARQIFGWNQQAAWNCVQDA